MISIILNIKLSENNGWVIEFCPEFEGLSTQQKLDLLQDSVHELNLKWREVNENY